MGSEQDLHLRWTQLPNALMDFVIPLLRESEEKVLLYVLRRTYGFQNSEGHHKEQDSITFSQFIKGRTAEDGRVRDFGCGVSRPKLAEALSFLQAIDLVLRVDAAAGKEYAGRGAIGQYRLNLDSTMVHFLNQCLKTPESARKLMVNFLNQKREMVKKVNQSRREARNLKRLSIKGKESEPLQNGKESEPLLVKKVNHSLPENSPPKLDSGSRKKRKKDTTPDIPNGMSTPHTPDVFPPDDHRHVWTTRTKRVPKDFPRQPTLIMVEWAKKTTPLIDLAFEHGAFIDYDFKDAHFDWYAAWRGWMRRSQKDAKRELDRRQLRGSPQVPQSSGSPYQPGDTLPDGSRKGVL